MTAVRQNERAPVQPGEGAGHRLGDIVQLFGGRLIGDPEHRVRQVATLRSAGPQHVSFCHDARYLTELAATEAGAVVVAPALAERTDRHRIVADDAYLYFAKLSTYLNPASALAAGIDASAVVSRDATIDPSASIGPNCTIGSGTRIQAGVRIGAGTVVGADCEVGEGTRIDPNVTVYSRTRIGARCVVLAGAVIGSDGFGHARESGRWLKIPQIGAVIVGDDVEVGANTTIDRGALDDTVIEDGVKLDNQIQIGHNCRIGAHSAIAGCVGIAGSTTIGKRCMIGGAAMISGHLQLCDDVIVSGGTLISKSIASPGVYTGVYPFEPNKRWSRNAASVRHLDSLVTRIRALERALAELERAQENKQ